MENIRERIVSCAGRVWFCAKELLKWLALAMITGVPCGIIGAAFDLAVEHVTELRTEHTAILFLLPVIGLVIVAFYKAAKLEGVSTDDMIDCVKDGKPIRFWLLPVMFISTVLTHLRCHRIGALWQECAGAAGAGHLYFHGADPPGRRQRWARGRCFADGRHHRLVGRRRAAPE